MKQFFSKIFTKEFLTAAAIRAVRTFAQTACATIGTTAVFLSEVNWAAVASASALAAILSIFTSIATGLPEASAKPEAPEAPEDDE